MTRKTLLETLICAAVGAVIALGVYWLPAIGYALNR